MVPQFREMGEMHLSGQVQIQRKELLLFFEGINILAEDVGIGYAESETVNGSIRKILYHMTQLKQQWCSVLPMETYSRCIADLVDPVLNFMMEPVLNARDVSADLCHILHQSFTLLLQGYEDLFGADKKSILKQVKNWERFSALISLLMYSLDEVSDALSRGNFREFAAAEMESLVTSCFERNDKRATIISAIRKMGQ